MAAAVPRNSVFRHPGREPAGRQRPVPRTVDESFLALPLSALTDAALTRARDLGCEHADLRVERIRTQTIRLRDARPEALADAEDLGLAVRVVHEEIGRASCRERV